MPEGPLLVRHPVGIGWRPPIAGFIAGLAGRDGIAGLAGRDGRAGRDGDPDVRLGFCELVAENLTTVPRLPAALEGLRDQGLPLVPHGVTLSLGGAAEPDPRRIEHLAACARSLNAPLVSEHIAFVRAEVDGVMIESGHLLPVPRTDESLDVLTRNIRIAQAGLDVPLAVEPVAALLDLGGEYREADFLTELVERTGVWLLLDLANVYANALNTDEDPAQVLSRMPVERIAYCHIAGGRMVDGLYHDTHQDPVPEPVLELVGRLCELRAAAGLPPPPMMLERDGDYPTGTELIRELRAIAAATSVTAARSTSS